MDTNGTQQDVLHVTQQLLHTTARIECTNSNGLVSSGTGFYYSFQVAGLIVPTIVTNRHVLASAAQCSFYVTLADKQGLPNGHMKCDIYDFSDKSWVGHPDESVDLALMFIGPLLNHLEERGQPAFYRCVVESLLPSEEALSALFPLEEILLIGYPNGIWDYVNNLPIVRRGITATPCNRNYRGKSEFVVDAAVFPGSSGSPVFLYNQGTYASPKGLHLGGRLNLLGVIYAVHQHTASGEIHTIEAPTSTKQVALSPLPNHLGICVSSSRIRDFTPIVGSIVEAAQARVVPPPLSDMGATGGPSPGCGVTSGGTVEGADDQPHPASDRGA